MRSPAIERIEHNGELLALIVSHTFREPGVHFFTSGDFSQQLGFMRHPTGWRIAPHLHKSVAREVHWTQEVLLVLRGRLRVDFYATDRTYLESRVVTGGDVLLLAKGGHGFDVLDEVEMIEVKQGPYAGDGDKTRFDGLDAAAARRGV